MYVFLNENMFLILFGRKNSNYFIQDTNYLIKDSNQCNSTISQKSMYNNRVIYYKVPHLSVSVLSLSSFVVHSNNFANFNHFRVPV